MITTVTLNPALDRTIEVGNFAIGTVNRVSAARLDAGGKGINVSKMIKTLGGGSRALGILSGRSGEYIREYLDRSGIENDFVFTDGETRTNIKIVDSLEHTNTDINEPGPYVPEGKLGELEKKIFGRMDEDTLLVLSGSIPRGVPKDIYRRWTEKAGKSEARVILDCDGELLREGIKGVPYLVKPNIDEMETLLGRSISSLDDMLSSATEIMRLGVAVVVLSLGGDGALFVKDGAAIKAKGIPVEVKSTVGAGDSMVAALAYALESGMDFADAAALSVAAGTAKVTTSGTQPPELSSIIAIKNRVELEFIDGIR